MSRTSESNYNYFKKECIEFIYDLGLTEWDVYFQHGGVNDVYAQTAWENGSKVATITLCDDWDDLRPRTNAEIKRVALHEVLHIAMADIVSHAEARYISEEGLQAAEHTFIRRMEKLIINL